MGTARERREKRRQQVSTDAAKPRESRQVSSGDPKPPRQFHLPFSMGWLIVPAAVALVVLIVVVLGAVNPPEVFIARNAIWLDRQMSYSAPSDDALNALISTWKANQIGTIYLFASSLKADNQWSGAPEQANRFVEAEPLVASLVERIHATYPEVRLYAWVEVLADTPDNRLASPQVRATLKEFVGRMVNTLKFDGIMLDVKPVFNSNEDFLVLLRDVRAAIGLDTPLAVAVPADLTPVGTGINLPTFIAAGTIWTPEYKQRVSLQADQLIVTAYNSYLTDQVDYINWVSYQVTAWMDALADSTAELLISVPNYTLPTPSGSVPIAHDPIVESMAGALDGVTRALRALDTASFTRFTGVALYTDHTLLEDEWRIFSEKWLNAVIRPQPATN